MKNSFLLVVVSLVFVVVGRGDRPLIATTLSDRIGEKLGTIHFDVSGNAAAQAHVVRGVKLLHHMMYIEADREFAAAVAADPACSLAYWGRAMTIVHPLWPDVPAEDELKKGWEWVVAGMASGPRTERERAYLATMETYFRDAWNRDQFERLRAVNDAWERVADAFPDDLDAAAFSALFHLAPARFLPKDKSHRIQLAAAVRLQEVLAKLPDHPGAQHYKIHAFDFPLLADRALEICDSYGKIAPDVPHALHMPTHIFTRRGQWDKSIEFNRRSAEAARKLSQTDGAISGHLPHALDYMVYAHLQRGEYGHADAVRQQVLAIPGPYASSNRGAMAFAFAAIPARCALERQDWAAAAALEPGSPATFPWDDKFPHCESMVRFARALGAVRSGSLDAARSQIAQQEGLSRRISAAQPGSYWASQAETQALATRAWLKLKEGSPEAALALMRQAVALEGAVDKEAVTPGEVLPAGDLLGDMLGELNRPREALAAFEAVLATSPNRFNSLYGAGRMAELCDESETARKYYEQLLAVAPEADPGIARLRHAAGFLATNGRSK